MICSKCGKGKIIKNARELYGLESKDCANCNEIGRFIEIHCRKASEVYVQDIYNWLLLITPIKKGDNVIIGNSRKYEFPRFDEYETIKELTTRLCLNNTYYRSKNEKITILNKLLGFLYDDLRNIIIKNPVGYLISFISNLEYNRFIAQNIVNWASSYGKGFEKTKDEFTNIIIETLDFVKSFDVLGSQQYKNNINISEIYPALESQIALDVQSLELASEMTYEINKGKGIFVENKSKLEYGNALRLARAINYVRLLKVELSEGIHNSAELYINIEGNLSIKDFRNFSNNFSSTYYRDITSRKSVGTNIELMTEMNEISKKYIGITLNHIYDFAMKLDNVYEMGDEFLVGDFDSWMQVTKELTGYSEEEVKALLNFLMFDSKSKEVFEDSAYKRNRIARKCLLCLGDIVLCPVGLLKYSLIGLYLDIINGDIHDESFRNEIKNLLQIKDQEFEVAVYNELRDNLGDVKIKMDIKQKDIKVEGKYIILPGQIDILLFYNRKIFVIECKNSNLKINPKSVANEYGRFSKINSKSDQIKLRNKIDTIVSNKDSVIKFMDDDKSKYINSEVIGVMTTRNFSIATIDDDLLYPVITWTNLCEWIKNYS